MGDSNPAEELSAKIEEEEEPPLPPARHSAAKVNITGLNLYHPALDQ